MTLWIVEWSNWAIRIWVRTFPSTPDSSLKTTHRTRDLASRTDCASLNSRVCRLRNHPNHFFDGYQATLISGRRHRLLTGVLQGSRRPSATMAELLGHRANLSQSGTVSWDPTATPTPTYLGLALNQLVFNSSQPFLHVANSATRVLNLLAMPSTAIVHEVQPPVDLFQVSLVS